MPNFENENLEVVTITYSVWNLDGAGLLQSFG